MLNHINTPIPEVDEEVNVVEQITPFVAFEWLFDKQGFAVTAWNGSRDTTDAWFNRVCEIAMDWPSDTLLLGLYHYDFDLMTMSPHARARAESLRDLRPELEVRTAVVVRGQVIAQIAQLFMRLKPNKNLVVRFFFRREAAEAWLKQELERSQRAKR